MKSFHLTNIDDKSLCLIIDSCKDYEIVLQSDMLEMKESEELI